MILINLIMMPIIPIFMIYILVIFIVFTLSPLIFLLGLIKPSWIIRWGGEEGKNRVNLFKIFLKVFLALILLLVVNIVITNGLMEEWNSSSKIISSTFFNILLSIIFIVENLILVFGLIKPAQFKRLGLKDIKDRNSIIRYCFPNIIILSIIILISFEKNSAALSFVGLIFYSYLIYKRIHGKDFVNKITKLREKNSKKHLTNKINKSKEEKKEIFDLIFENREIKSKLEEFILNNTKEYDNKKIEFSVYTDSVVEFLNYIGVKLRKYAECSPEKLNPELREYLKEKELLGLSNIDLRLYIEEKKSEIYIKDMRETLRFGDGENLEEKIEKYIEYFQGYSFKTLYLETLSKLLNKDYDEILIQLIFQYNEKIFDLIFGNREMKSKLEEFILNNTKEYDNKEMDNSIYLDNLNTFLEYIIKRIEIDRKYNKDEFNPELKTYLKEISIFDSNTSDFKLYIEGKKSEIYIKEMRAILRFEDEENLQEKIEKYINVFGEMGLEELNLFIFSNLLGVENEELSLKVKREYEKQKEEYELRRMEKNLFGTSVGKRELKYVDSLSGFEFEDYLEELFIEFGYKSKELPYSNDYGADLIIDRGFEDIVIQAKKYNSSNVGVQAVQEVIAAKSHYKSDIAMVITNSYYTDNAKEAAIISDVIMIDRDGLDRMLREGRSYFNSLI